MLTFCIKTEKLTKYYLGKKIVGIKNLSLEVQSGEIFGFIGPNGAGKSTTIRLLLDLIRPTSGQLSLFGLDPKTNGTEIRKDIGYLPGEIFLQENITGKECLDYYKSFRRSIDNRYLKSLLDRFDLDL
ncbi:MAG TPA: ATP-binding cassette domain-containing protein, partial [bacterium]|nr:ATP-binding cassette domain-containing protein [bacterium]